jgi:nanoRNase/pAp phosphatase (c-di-AMP/oligoRNAs hydrolase)
MRSTDGTVDVSRIARELGGGGHRQAAGATSDLPLDELLATIRKGIQEQL